MTYEYFDCGCSQTCPGTGGYNGAYINGSCGYVTPPVTPPVVPPVTPPVVPPVTPPVTPPVVPPVTPPVTPVTGRLCTPGNLGFYGCNNPGECRAGASGGVC